MWPLNLTLAIFINLLLWECFIRLFISSPCTQVFDEKFGYMNKPKVSYVWSSEGYSQGKFNSLGFNDREPMTDKQVKRIFFVGDSYTEAFQVPLRNSYLQLVEENFKLKSTKWRIDCIKIARDGFTPADYLPVIERFQARYRPEMFILQFGEHSGGDLLSNDIQVEYGANGNIIALSTKEKKEDRLKEVFRVVINRSALAYYSARRYKPVLMRLLTPVGKGLPAQAPSEINYSRAEKDQAELRNRLTFILSGIKKNPAKLLVLYLPPPGFYLNDNENLQEVGPTFKTLREVCKQEDILFLDMTSAFKTLFKSEQQFANGFCNTLPGKGHLNRFGHSMVAKELESFILSSSTGLQF